MADICKVKGSELNHYILDESGMVCFSSFEEKNCSMTRTIDPSKMKGA